MKPSKKQVIKYMFGYKLRVIILKQLECVIYDLIVLLLEVSRRILDIMDLNNGGSTNRIEIEFSNTLL